MPTRAARVQIAAMFLVTAGLMLSSVGMLRAQDPLADLLGAQPGAGAAGRDVQISATLTTRDPRPGGEAVLSLSVELPRDFYIYSTDDRFGGATKLEITETSGLTPVDDKFQADRPPKVTFVREFGQEVEKFYDRVTWTRRFTIDQDARPDEVSVSGTLSGQYCSDGETGLCIPIRPARPFQASLETVEAGAVHPFALDVQPTRPSAGGEAPDPLDLRFELSPRDAAPGERVTLSITATVRDNWYVFALTQNSKNSGLPTVIGIDTIHGLEAAGRFAPAAPHEVKQTDDGKEQRIHRDRVTWTREFRVLPETEPGAYGVSGSLRYQVCSSATCLPPKPVRFSLGDLSQAVAFTELKGADLDFDSFAVADAASTGSLPLFLLFGFLGGLILNVMPCVLPVIAIKAMSFVQQAGESRGRILALNVAYSLGVLSVFLVLATLVAGIFTEKFGWGELFQGATFNLVMAGVIFAMALSLLGVFEIPVPGFVGSGAGRHQQEGLAGAFLTGIFATLLATPCSGPFLGVALAWAAAQPPTVTYLFFVAMGLGLAFPYLVFGLFPQAIGWLPRPGNWMLRFKEACGLVLMGTVLWFLYILQQQDINPIAVLVMLLGLALGLWMVGSLYDITSSARRKLIVRTSALCLMAAVGAAGYLMAYAPRLPWESFSEERLQASLADQRTVLVEFTADW